MAKRGASDRAGLTAPTAADIERIGRRVLAELPDLFRAQVRNVVIKVEDLPDEETEREMDSRALTTCSGCTRRPGRPPRSSARRARTST